MDVYRCSICLEFLAPSLRSLLTHIGHAHSNEPNFHVTCGIDGCAKTYKIFLSFRNHVNRKHHVKRKRDDLFVEDDDEVEDADDRAEIEYEPFDLQRQENQVRRVNAMCLLKFKETGRVPQTVVNNLVESTTHVVQNSVNLLKCGVQDNLRTAGIDFNEIPGLANLFNDDDSIITRPFLGIDKERLQYKYYKEQFNLVVSNFSLYFFNFRTFIF